MNPQLEQREYVLAFKNFAWYLQQRPDDIDVVNGRIRQTCAQSRRSRSFGKAFDLSETVLRRDPSRNSVRRRVVELAWVMGQYPNAKAHLKLLGTENREALRRRSVGLAAMDKQEQTRLVALWEKRLSELLMGLKRYDALPDEWSDLLPTSSEPGPELPPRWAEIYREAEEIYRASVVPVLSGRCEEQIRATTRPPQPPIARPSH